MKASRPLLAVAALLSVAVSACGDKGERMVVPTSTLESKLEACRSVDPRHRIALCKERANPSGHGVFVARDVWGGRLLPVEPPGPTPTARDGGRIGHWAWAALSPDGSTLLAQWSAECEVPIAFFVPAEGGQPRVVSDEEDWATSPASVALGWTPNGRAIVLFPEESPCGSAGKPGLYLVSVDGEHERIRAVDPLTEKLVRSLQPRSAASLR
jgi:hypothetical protein